MQNSAPFSRSSMRESCFWMDKVLGPSLQWCGVATDNTKKESEYQWESAWPSTQPCPPADKHCQLAAGPRSLAMCSFLINRTHSQRQVQANTKPFPWAVVFSSCLHRCQLKRFYYDANCETTLMTVVEGVCGGEWTRYCTAPLFLSVREILHQNTKQKSWAWFDNLELILKRTGTGNWPLYLFIYFLLVLNGFWKVLARIKFSCVVLKFMALCSFWLDSCFS